MPTTTEKLDRDGLAAVLGARVAGDGPDRLTVELEVTPDHCDAGGRVVPAVMCALADCAMSLISNRERTEVAVVARLNLTNPEAQGRRLRAAISPAGPVGGATTDWAAVISVDGDEVARFAGTTFAVN